MEKRTPEEIADLKEQWQVDPCWDIEDTEGFEAHREELKEYRIKKEAEWAAESERERVEELERKATELQCGYELAAYIIKMERKLDRMADRLNELWYNERSR